MTDPQHRLVMAKALCEAFWEGTPGPMTSDMIWESCGAQRQATFLNMADRAFETGRLIKAGRAKEVSLGRTLTPEERLRLNKELAASDPKSALREIAA